jgi:lysophospholipase
MENQKVNVPIVTLEASKTFYDAIASRDKTIKIYDRLYHEIMNEPEKDTVIGDILQWLNAHILR